MQQKYGMTFGGKHFKVKWPEDAGDKLQKELNLTKAARDL